MNTHLRRITLMLPPLKKSRLIVVIGFALITFSLFSIPSVLYSHFQTSIGPIFGLVWSPDSTKIAVTRDSYVDIMNASNGTIVRTLTGANLLVNAVDWSPDGTKIAGATGEYGSGVYIWNAATGQIVATQSGTGIALKWNTDNTRIAITADSNGIGIWNISTGQTAIPVLVGNAIDWSPDGTRLVSGSYDQNPITVTNITTGQQLLVLPGHQYGVGDVDWSPDGTKIASGGSDNTVRVWNAATGSSLLALTGHTKSVSSVAWNANNTTLASASGDGTVRLWNTQTGQSLGVIQAGGVIRSVAWSPDGTKLAYGGDSGVVQVYPVPNICPCTLFGSTTPANPSNIGNPPAVNLGVVFKPSVNGQVTGIRFYKLSGNGGTHKGYLWSAAGTQLGNVTFTGETATGWQTATFSTPISVTANTVYVASYHAPQGKFAYDNNTFTTGRSVPPLYALATGETSPGNGTYIFGAAGLFPNATFNATNYWVDVVFSPT